MDEKDSPNPKPVFGPPRPPTMIANLSKESDQKLTKATGDSSSKSAGLSSNADFETLCLKQEERLMELNRTLIQISLINNPDTFRGTSRGFQSLNAKWNAIAVPDWSEQLSTATISTSEGRGRQLLSAIESFLFHNYENAFNGCIQESGTNAFGHDLFKEMKMHPVYLALALEYDPRPWKPDQWPHHLHWILHIARSIIRDLPEYAKLTDEQYERLIANSPCAMYIIEGITMNLTVLRGIIHQTRLKDNSEATVPITESRITQPELMAILNGPVERLCTICFIPMLAHSGLTALSCYETHVFHKECIEHHLRTESKCPVCAKSIS